ncbi:hypothetical protein [Sinorhizobium medicae]|nr:hypothetical protein [Sinorhizobium medicae]
MILSSSPAHAEGNQPLILSTRVQEIARDYSIEKRLDIDWNNAKPEDITRYVGLLASAQTIAGEIAARNDRKQPEEADYRAAFISLCLWPPNKPPFVEQSWPAQIPAFYNEDERALLRKAVGTTAASLPFYFSQLTQAEFEKAATSLPTEQEEYYADVFNVPLLMQR